MAPKRYFPKKLGEVEKRNLSTKRFKISGAFWAKWTIKHFRHKEKRKPLVCVFFLQEKKPEKTVDFLSILFSSSLFLSTSLNNTF